MLACTGSTPTRSTNGLVGCPAWRLGDELTWCLDGQVYTVGVAASWLIDMGIMSEPADLDHLGGGVADAAGVTFVPALAGLAAVLEAACEGGVHRHVVGHRARPPGARRHRWHRRSGGVAGAGRWSRPVRTAHSPARRRWPHPQPHAVAGAGRSAAVPGGGVPLAARHRVGRGCVGRTRRRPTGALRRVDWPSAVVEPAISADEAAHRLARWRAVADATMDH